MTAAGTMRADLDDRWTIAIPDPTVRAAWRAAFGDDAHVRVGAWRLAFHAEDPVEAAAIAARWEATTIPPGPSAYLHRHGISPSYTLMRDTLLKAGHEARPGYSRPFHGAYLRVAALLVHPHLTRDDRDAILASGITLDELDDLIATGAFDRSALTLMGALR